MLARLICILALLIGMSLIACGGSQTAEPDGDGTAVTEPEPEPEPDPDVPPPVPEMLVDCESSEEVEGRFVRVIFQCDPQLVSYYVAPATIEHADVVRPLTETPGFRVDVESHEIPLQGTTALASILYHTDEIDDILMFALYVVTLETPSGGTQVINCFMTPTPEQVAWCDEAISALASVGAGV